MRSRSPGRSPGRSPVHRLAPEKSDIGTSSPRKIGFEGVSYELSGDLYLLLARDTCIPDATLMPARSPRDKLLRLQPAERQFQSSGSTRRQLSDGRCAFESDARFFSATRKCFVHGRAAARRKLHRGVSRRGPKPPSTHDRPTNSHLSASMHTLRLHGRIPSFVPCLVRESSCYRRVDALAQSARRRNCVCSVCLPARIWKAPT